MVGAGAAASLIHEWPSRSTIKEVNRMPSPYIRPKSWSRPVPDVLLIDPTDLGNQHRAAAWVTALSDAHLDWHPEDRAIDILDGRSDAYLFTFREARLAQRLMWAAYDTGLDPCEVLVHLSYGGAPVCGTCGFLYEPGPRVRCCDDPTPEPKEA
jgi:hypothetical protein